MNLRHLIPLLTGLVSFVVFFVTYQSYFPHASPYHQVETVFFAVDRDECHIDIEYSRMFEVDRDFVAVVQISLVHGTSGLTIDLPPLHRHHTKGAHFVHRVTQMPKNTPAGDWLMKTVVVWQPMGSIEDHWIQLPDARFVIPEKP